MALSFNNISGRKAERKLLIHYVDVGDDPDNPEWEVQGATTEDSTIDFDPDTTEAKNILGENVTDVNNIAASQDFDPNDVRTGHKLGAKLLDFYLDGNYSKFATFRVLTVMAFSGTTGAYEANVQEDCTIYPTSIGGSDWVGIPFSIAYSNKITRGTVDTYYPNGTPAFTPNGATPNLGI